MPERPPVLTAAAGEFYVAYKLSALGHSVGIPRANTPGVDLLVGNPTGSMSLLLQVKTSARARRESRRTPSGNH